MTVSPLQINLVEFDPKGPSKLIVHVQGVWRGRTPPRRRPVLVVDVGGRPRRFSPVATPRRRSFDRFADWSASFAVPASLGPSLDGHMSLSFGEDLELIPLPSLFEARGSQGQGPDPEARGDRMAARRRSPRLERRAVSESGKARRAARVRDEARVTNATARLKRELEALQQTLREATAERDKYYRTANDMARHVANMHNRMSAALKSEQQIAQERDRLAQDLASIQAELHDVSEPAKRAGTAGRA